MNNQLTIVIPCKNEGFGIINVLKLLRNQHIYCQIIIADSSTDIDTFNLLHNYYNYFNKRASILPFFH